MSRFLILDIGAGTMDILFYDSASGLHYKTVARSPVLTIAEEAAGLPGSILVTGVEMGGGPLSEVLRQRSLKSEVVMSASAAATLNHDPDKVRGMGIRVVDDSEAMALREGGTYSHLSSGDIEADRIEGIVEGMGIPFSFDVIGVCAQDHGIPPAGMSHLDYRHRAFKGVLEKTPFPGSLLFRHDEVPPSFHRLTCLAREAKRLPCREAYVMDSGMAAILGASTDPRVKAVKRAVVLDIATSHTVGAAMDGEELAGFFEYHTRDITQERLEGLLVDLAEGRLEHEGILKEGGHGAYIRKALGFSSVEIILATGPRRRLLEGSRLPITLGAPLGDNMMTGTAGLLEAISRRKGLDRPAAIL